MHTRTTLTLSLMLAALLLVGLQPQTAKAAAGGQFEGRLITEWLDDGRNMKLIDSFAYRSPSQQLWPVPSGTVVNGASIPRFLWSLIGSPFGDKYRKASVIHDYHCEVQLRPSEEVHHTFYEAMLDSGVGASQAWIMYQAVLRFGPSWQVSASAACFKEDGSIDFENCAVNNQRAQARGRSKPCHGRVKRTLPTSSRI